MTRGYANPAIYAGLVGAATVGVPTYAHAIEMFGTEVPLSETGLVFVAGCVSGAVVGSGVSLVVEHLLDNARERKLEEAALANAAHAGASAQAVPAHYAEAQESAPAHFASPKQAKHAKAMAQKAPTYGRHSAAAQAVREWEMTGEIRMQDVPAAGLSHNLSQDFPEIDIPDTDNAYPQVAEPTNVYLQADPSNNYDEVAESYVKKLTLAERMSVRAKGVADVLYERLHANKMEGLPIIARADGTVADMGEAWWENAFESDQVVGAQGPASTQPQEVSAQNTAAFIAQASYASQVPAVEVSKALQAPAAVQVPQVELPQVAQVEANPVEVSATEQNRWSDKQQDLWAVALSALDDRFAEQIALGPSQTGTLFVDEIGNADTIDEPEGLEPVTAFMSFKPLAGHPEVEDTSSYVDLLIDQEFSQNKSVAARKSVRGVLRSYLKVIDGGTGELKGAKHAAPAHMMSNAQVAY